MKRKRRKKTGQGREAGPAGQEAGGRWSGRDDPGGGPPDRDGADGQGPLVRDDAPYLEILLIVVALAAVVIRVIYLRADPPVGLSWSQALFTDGARAIDGARNRIMYGEFMADRVYPVVLFYPISNAMAYVIYSIGGIGLAQANLTGVLPALAALALVYNFMRRTEGKVAALLALWISAIPYIYVIYTRTPLLESLQIFLLVAAFVTLLRGGGGYLLTSGVLVGAAAFMVKLHALHFAVVGVAFLLLRSAIGGNASRRSLKPVLLFLAGIALSFTVWLAAVYSADPAAVSKYFESNILVSQSGDYKGATILSLMSTRLRAFFHVGSGIDGFFAETPLLSVLALLGLLSVLTGCTKGNRSLRPYELLSGIWFVVLISSLSLLSYRPLRYFVPLITSMCMLATSFTARLADGEALLHTERPRWFKPALMLWLLWVLIHVQHDVIFQAVKPNMTSQFTPLQQTLLRYDFSILRQLLITGGVAVGILLFLGRRLESAAWRFGRVTRRNLLVLALGTLVVLNAAKFADYALNRKYSILETAQSLERITSAGVFMVGDCATTLSLETDFRTLPSYGELIRRDERESFEQYPVTHFLVRFPTLYEYLLKNYPGSERTYVPVNRYYLCGMETTVIRYEKWPGYPKSYTPTEFEEGMMLLSRAHVNNALLMFQSFLNDHPDSYEAMLGQAVCLAVSGSLEDARAKVEEAIEIAPGDALTYHVYKDILDALQRGGTER